MVMWRHDFLCDSDKSVQLPLLAHTDINTYMCESSQPLRNTILSLFSLLVKLASVFCGLSFILVVSCCPHLYQFPFELPPAGYVRTQTL